MKTVFAILAVLVLSLGCTPAKIDVPGIVIAQSFPAAIPGASLCAAVRVGTAFPGYQHCNATPECGFTCNLPPITRNVHFNPPGGLSISAYVDRIDIRPAIDQPLSFIQNLIVEVSGGNAADEHLVDYTPSVPPGTTLSVFPSYVDLAPYLEAPSISFAMAISGTVPESEVSLDTTIFISGDTSYHRGL